MTAQTLLLRNAELLCTMNPADNAGETARAGDNAGAEIRGGGPLRPAWLEGALRKGGVLAEGESL